MGSSAGSAVEETSSSLFGDVRLNDNAVVGMWYWDVLNNRLYADAGMADLFGVDRDDAMHGVEVDAFVNGIYAEDRERVAIEVARCTELAIDFRYEYRLAEDDGERRLAAFARCHRTPDGRASHYVGVALDVTEMRSEDTVTAAAQVADHLMRAYRIATAGNDEELKRELKKTLFLIGSRLAIEAGIVPG